MTLPAHCRMFGRYNVWANARLYEAAARLDGEQYRADRGAGARFTALSAAFGEIGRVMAHSAQLHAAVTGPARVTESRLTPAKSSKTVHPLSSTPPNMLKKRVLLSLGEFHSGPKRATRGVREQRRAGGVRNLAVAAGSQFEV